MSTKTSSDPWSPTVLTRDGLLSAANDFALFSSLESIRNGTAGSELRRAYPLFAGPEKGLFSVNSRGQLISLPAPPAGYLYDQGSTASDLVIGPFRLAHSVQNIQISEQKAVISPKTVRSDRPLVLDSGGSRQTATLTFIFSGLEEINQLARGLVALFRVCPITSIRNEMLSMEWGPHQADLIDRAADIVLEATEKIGNIEVRNKLYTNLAEAIREGKFMGSYLNTVKNDFKNYGPKVLKQAEILTNRLLTYKRRTPFVAVALESLSVQTVPDLPLTISLTLTVAKIDVSSATEAGTLEYQGFDPGSSHADPKNAYWLKKYLAFELIEKDTPFLPFLTDADFGEVRFDFFDKPLAEIPSVDTSASPKTVYFNTEAGSSSNGARHVTRMGGKTATISHQSKIGGQSATITNHFGYQRMIGKSTTCAHHVGTSARQLTLDLQFITGPEGDDIYESFNQFKELSDELVRTEVVYERIMGWDIKCVAALLLGGSTSQLPATKHGVYVPLASTTDTGEAPHLKDTRITLAETNTSFLDSYQIILDSGGISYEDLKDFFLGKAFGNTVNKNAPVGICPGEETFRAGEHKRGKHWGDAAWDIFWPVGSSGISTGGVAILNRDVFRAALFTKGFDKGSKLYGALVKDPIFSGRLRVTETPDAYSAFGLGYDYILGGFLFLSAPEIDDGRITNSSHALVSAIDRVFEGGIFSGLKDADGTSLADAIKDKNKKMVRRILKKAEKEDDIRLRIINDIVSALTGSPGDMDELLKDLASNPALRFTLDFKKAIFEALVKRPRAPKELPYIFEQQGMMQGFALLYKEYRQSRDLYPGWKDSEPKDAVRHLDKQWRHTTYRDFSFFPSYYQLFGEHWREYCPTFDDLGINVFSSRFLVRPSGRPSLRKLHDNPAMMADDKVPPHIWFHHPRKKKELYDHLNMATEKSGNNVGGFLKQINNLTLHMNITDTHLIEKLKGTEDEVALLKRFRDAPDHKIWGPKAEPELKKLAETLVESVRRSVQKPDGTTDRHSLASLKEQVNTLLPATDPDHIDRTDIKKQPNWKLFYDTHLSPESPKPIALYMSVMGRPTEDAGDSRERLSVGRNTTRMQLSGLLGAGTFRVIHHEKFEVDLLSEHIQEDGSASSAADHVNTTHGGPLDLAFTRHLRKTMDHTARSSITQVADDADSVAKLWPTIKIYFIDRRGDEVLADDLLFTTDSILSVDITQDKQDAALAVIRMGDPLRLIQNGTFYKSSTINVGGKRVMTAKGIETHKGTRVVLPNQRGSQKSFLKSRKIEQGRPVMIKMGYDSVAENLHTVFTGRIAEIELGDTLTLVCQGWKSELINRHVNLYTKDKNNWGPKDLVVLATQLADPDGFGAHYNQEDALQILSNLDKIGGPEQIRHVVNTVQEGTQNVYGSLSFMSWLYNGDNVANHTAFEEARMWEGLDTRLKNVWYPDISKNINNFLNWRRLGGYPPDFVNDHWIVPLQPCWDVLQEASRHTWGYICQVIPYDHEATLFFGNPDAMYFWTRGHPETQKHYLKFRNTIQKDAMNLLLEGVVGDFLREDTEISSHKVPLILRAISPRNPKSRKHVKLINEFSNQITSAVTFDDNSDFLTHLVYTVNKVRERGALFGTKSLGVGRDIDVSRLLSFSFIQTVLHSEVAEEDKILTKRLLTYKVHRIPVWHDGGPFQSRARELINQSDLPFRAYETMQGNLIDDPIPILMSILFGFNPSNLSLHWSNYHTDVAALLKGNSRGDGEWEATKVGQNADPTPVWKLGIPGTPAMTEDHKKGILEDMDRFETLIKEAREERRSLAGRPFTQRINDIPWPQYEEFKRKIENLPKEFKGVKEMLLTFKAIQRRTSFETEGTEAAPSMVKEVNISSALGAFVNMRKIIRSTAVDFNVAEEVDPKFTEGYKFPLYKIDGNQTLGDVLNSHRAEIKAFVFFLARYLLYKGGPKALRAKTRDALNDMSKSIHAPTLRTFRVHHYVSSDKDIIDNKIVASTAQMWNTVVISYPQGDPVDTDSVGGRATVGAGSRIQGNTSWVYWPSTKVSQVRGLQFHPGLSIANKKMRTFTELNCSSEPLASKLACNRLAEGLRRMYTGTLTIRGRHIKPYDRIVLDDTYTGMKGVLEVESVVHHFNPEIGWVSNITPNAVCDANPGAAAIQTALLEATYRARMNTVDWVFTGVNVLMVFFTGGIGSAAIKGAWGAVKGGGHVLKAVTVGTKSTVAGQGTLKGIGGGTKALINMAGSTMKSAQKSLGVTGPNPFAIAAAIGSKYRLGRLAGKLMASYSLGALANSVLHHIGQSASQTSWVKGHNTANQLPVIFSPLMFNGTPWTAGIEADDILYTVPFYDTYYSWAQFVGSYRDLANRGFNIED